MVDNPEIITIDVKALLKTFWRERFLILTVTIFFSLCGIFYAFTAGEEFVSEGRIMPEISGGSVGTLGGLANLVGIGGFELGLKNSTDAIRPDLYPDVIESTPFFMNLFRQKFIDSNGDTLRFDTFYNFKVENSEIADTTIIIRFKGRPKGVMVLTELDEIRIKDLRERINCSIDKKTGVISISAKMPDPVIAASVSEYAMRYLTDYVTEYRTKKAKKEMDFLADKVTLAKEEFFKDQSRKASYADRYSVGTIRLQSADVQRERLESEYKLSTTVYNELLKKFEEAKIKLEQETPVFQVLEPPVAPTLSSEPKKLIIIVVMSLGGLLWSFLFALIYKKNYKGVINR